MISLEAILPLPPQELVAPSSQSLSLSCLSPRGPSPYLYHIPFPLKSLNDRSLVLGAFVYAPQM